MKLPFDTSLLIYASDALPEEREEVRGVQVMSLAYALCKISPAFFSHEQREAELMLRAIRNPGELLRVLVGHHFVRAAGRIVGGYRFLGEEQMARALLSGLESAGLRIQEVNPFEEGAPLLEGRERRSLHAARIVAMWREYRSKVIDCFPEPPGLPPSPDGYLKRVDEDYLQDAYNSLSIEGYRVSEELINRVRRSEWSPESDAEDRKMRDALAARGYYDAFLAAKQSLKTILLSGEAGVVVRDDLPNWYRKLFGPCVAAGIIDAGELYGYRRHQVYIRNSRHTPPPAFALNDAMEAYYDCLAEEQHAAVRAVLGHFVFVYIHPYMDGNGRIGRFLMNAMLASGGYPWTIVHVDRRDEYLESLEAASSGGDIEPLTQFLRSELER